MEHSKWNEEQIQKHLENMPSFRDKRSKEAIFQKVQLRLVQSDNKKKKSIKVWGIPAFASACAVALMIILSPAAIKPFQERAENDKQEAKFVKEEVNQATSKKSATGFTMNNQKEADLKEAPKYHAPILATEQEQDWVTIAYMDEQAQLLVPVSFFVGGGNSYLSQFQEELKKFQPGPAGLAPSPFENMKISEKDDSLVFDIEPGTLTEADTKLFEQMIDLTFADEYTDAYLFSNGVAGYELGNYGKKDKFENLGVPGGPHFMYVSGTQDEYLVSSYGTGFHKGYKSLEEALNAMDELPGDPMLRPVLPAGMVLKAEETKGLTTIIFPEGTELQDNEETRKMLDAIMLTANSYGSSAVMFKNSGAEQI
ncbi:hypothetical protein ACFFJY_19335 [Fictibacillus aquaticus]